MLSQAKSKASVPCYVHARDIKYKVFKRKKYTNKTRGELQVDKIRKTSHQLALKSLC